MEVDYDCSEYIQSMYNCRNRAQDEPKEEDRLVKVSDQPKFLLNNLKMFLDDEKLTDVTITVDKKDFKLHKLILAASSDYFKAMFSERMVESQKNCINLYGISSKMFEVLVKFMYTSKIHLNHDNIQEILSAAMYLQIEPVINSCSLFLTLHLTQHNCLSILKIAEEYSLVKMQNMVYSYMCHILSVIVMSDVWGKLTQSQMVNLLSTDLPVDMSEAAIVLAVSSWMIDRKLEEVDEKLGCVKEIISKLHMDQIPVQQIQWIRLNNFSKDLPKTLSQKRLFRNPWKDVSKDPAFVLKQIKPKPLIGNFNRRGMEKAILTIGGFQQELGVSSKIWYSPHGQKKWFHLTNIPHHEECNHGIAVLDNILYIVGGCFNQILQEVVHSYGLRYDPRLDLWRKIPTMKVDRCRFTLQACEGKLYAFGGATYANDMEGTNSCEVFTPETRDWDWIAALPTTGIAQHAGATIEINNSHYIYISGGVHREGVKDSMYRYDVTRNDWTICTPMLRPRADHTMIAYQNKIFVCGGWYSIPQTPLKRLCVQTLEVYDCLKDTWEFVTTLPTARIHEAIVCHSGKIYIIGGFPEDSLYFKETTAVETYDIASGVWSTDEKDVQKCWEHCCVEMYIPKRFNDPDYAQIKEGLLDPINRASSNV